MPTAMLLGTYRGHLIAVGFGWIGYALTVCRASKR